MKTPNDASTSQEHETLDGFNDSSDDSRQPDENMPIQSQIFGGQAMLFANWLDNPNAQYAKAIAVDWDKVNGNGMNRLVVNEDDHVHRDWELVTSSSCGSDFEVVDHDVENVDQESPRGGRVKDYGEGDGNVNGGAIVSTNAAHVNGNGMNRLVVNEDDHVHSDWELVTSSSCEGDFEVVHHDGESVDQESQRGGRVKDYGEGDGNLNEGAIVSTNDAQVLPMEPPADISLEPNPQMCPVGYIARIISNDQVVIRGYEGIRSLSQGTETWVAGRGLMLGVIAGPAKSRYYLVRCNIDGDVRSQIQPGNSVSIVRGLADRIQSDEDVKVSHGDDLSDDSKEAACKQMAKRQNDQRQRNSAGNRQGPSDKNVNPRATSSGSRAPSQEDASRANVGASRYAHQRSRVVWASKCGHTGGRRGRHQQ